ncbi:hypothetical protein [Lacrimispora sp.]|uniref:hypothetical protein n=1 Tax=Lacrimispora sp. TaxID=2719234 RepID=UPI0028AE26E0|nr:hypothetical protein [Lacrimispora sp.]
MTHHIIVKFIDTVSNKEELINQINDLFSHAAEIPGIQQVQTFSSCIDRANRHDLMIKMVFEPDILNVWDSSEIHKKWKDDFGKYLAAKTIFDCN